MRNRIAAALYAVGYTVLYMRPGYDAWWKAPFLWAVIAADLLQRQPRPGA